MSEADPRTVIEALAATAARHPDRPAMRHKRGGSWETITWSGYRSQVLRAARGLIALGVEPGRGVVIIGFNRPEWFVADLAAIHAGALPVGIYTSSTPEQCGYIARHCDAAVAVLDGPAQLERLGSAAGDLPGLSHRVLMSGESDEPGVINWAELLRLGDTVDEAALAARSGATRADGLCTLIYTSGTTGTPKAVMLSHHNILWTARTVARLLDIGPGDRFISYLPLSHIAEQMISLYAPLVAGSCSAFAESLERLGDNLREVRPDVLFGVPRVWEKFQAGIEGALANSRGLRAALVGWARRKGLAAGYAEQRGERPPWGIGLARRLVFAPLRRKLGLDRTRIFATSAAPISLQTLEFFLGFGIPILEVYGMSECTGPATLSLPGRYRTGLAGFAIPGSEIEIAADGEIRMRGPHVFLGYYKDEAATRETLDADGWLASGDIGELDDEGFLRVTDRKKDLIITSGGKNVAPQAIEATLRSLPAIGHAVLIGDRRKYLAALLTLDPARLAAEAEAAGSPAREPAEAAHCSVFRGYLEAQIAEVNRRLASYETIKRFALLAGDFSIDGGELTPTLKLKRRVIAEKYATEIDRLYAEA